MADRGELIRIVGNQWLNGTLYVTTRVRLVGTSNADGSKPTIYGRIVVSGGDLDLENVRIQSGELGAIFQAAGGSATLTDTEVAFSATSQVSPSTDRAMAAVYVDGGNVRIVRGSVGPGYSQAIAVSSGTLDVLGTLINGGINYAIFVSGGSATVMQSQISGLSGVFVAGSPNVSINSNLFNVSHDLFAVTLRGTPTGSLNNNRFVGGANTNWLCLRPTVTSMNWIGNAESDGAEFTAAVRRDSC